MKKIQNAKLQTLSGQPLKIDANTDLTLHDVLLTHVVSAKATGKEAFDLMKAAQHLDDQKENEEIELEDAHFEKVAEIMEASDLEPVFEPAVVIYGQVHELLKDVESIKTPRRSSKAK